MKTNKKRFLSCICTVLAVTMQTETVLATEFASYQRTGFVMDTVVTEKLYTSGEDITGELLNILEETENAYLSWTEENSEIYQINENSGQRSTVSRDMEDWLGRILKLSEDSEGAFDPTLGEIIRLWDIGGENQKIPEQAELEELLENVGWQKLSLLRNQLSLNEGMSLDLGAVGKGIGCDRAAAYLETQTEVTGALLNLGGSSVMTYGEKPDGSDWKIAIVNPRDPEGDYLGVVTMKKGEFLSTSGNYKKFFEENGVRYHHIFDPTTGYPARSGLSAVTVISSGGLEADGLSTACFILGWEKGAELLEKYGAAGLFVDEEGNLYMTGDMEERFVPNGTK